MSEDKLKTIEINVRGRVQGVDFRRSAAHFANSLRLTGLAENLPDGSVRVVGQGTEDELEELLKWCQRGSILAKVEGMDYRWYEDDKTYEKFQAVRAGSIIKDQVRSFLNLGKKITNDMFHDFSNQKELNVPNHVVIIPNGNRRWAKERGMKTWKAYWHVQNKIESLIDTARELTIPHLTVWGFSTENWKRCDEEVQQLMKVFETTVDRFKDKFHEDQIRFHHLGRKDRLPENLRNKLIALEDETKNYEGRSINIAIDYGGRDELLRAVDNALKSDKTTITEEEFSSLLDTKGLPDPDLIIRTAGEKRLSGMMPWQSIYSEYYSSNAFFPDFTIEHFQQAIMEYSSRKRTFGGDSKAKKNKANNFELNSV